MLSCVSQELEQLKYVEDVSTLTYTSEINFGQRAFIKVFLCNVPIACCPLRLSLVGQEVIKAFEKEFPSVLTERASALPQAVAHAVESKTVGEACVKSVV